MNSRELRERKIKGERLTMVTCYDNWSAKILAASPVDMILVGDSAAMVMHGFDDTIPATVDMIAAHVAAVKKGAPKKFIVADLPFMSFRSSLDTNVANVLRLIQAGANAVKLEAYDGNADFIRHLTESGVPVMGHTGLTPQFVNVFGGFKVQGRNEEQRRKIMADARGLEDAGCFAVVLECVPEDLAGEVTSSLKVPTIGIGAGLNCDGQVLVLQDLLGFNADFKPKFVRKYLDGAALVGEALDKFCSDVRTGAFPSEKEIFS